MKTTNRGTFSKPVPLSNLEFQSVKVVIVVMELRVVSGDWGRVATVRKGSWPTVFAKVNGNGLFSDIARKNPHRIV